LANTEAWKAVRGWLTSGGVLARKGGGEGTVRAKRRSAGGVGVFTEGGATFYREEVRWGRPGAFNGWSWRSFNAPRLKAPVTGDW
jgi:hypothetical protein